MFRLLYVFSGFVCGFAATICALTCGLATLGANNFTIAKYAAGAVVMGAMAMVCFAAARPRKRSAL